MHHLLLPLGSTGDVLPFCALGRRLVARGHSVTVAANPHFAGVIARAGLEFAPLGEQAAFENLWQSRRAVSRSLGFSRLMDWVATQVRPTYELAAAHRSSKIVAHPLAFGARVAEARHGLDTATILLSPAVLYSAHDPPVAPSLPNAASMPGWYKRGIFWALDHLILDPMIAPTLNRLRDEVGAARLSRVFRDGWNDEHLFVALYPEWFAPRQPDGPRRLEFAGFPLYDDGGGVMPLGLEQFLDEDSAPIVLTPGTNNTHARAFLTAALEAAARIGRRAVVLTPHNEIALPPHARRFDYAPFSRLLPRASALVHHGGIGTAAAAMAAGIPQVVRPFAFDQPDNGARIERLELGCALRWPSARRLADALARLLISPSVRAACKRVAGELADSRALDHAVDVLQVRQNAAQLPLRQIAACDQVA